MWPLCLEEDRPKIIQQKMNNFTEAVSDHTAYTPRLMDFKTLCLTCLMDTFIYLFNFAVEAFLSRNNAFWKTK